MNPLQACVGLIAARRPRGAVDLRAIDGQSHPIASATASGCIRAMGRSTRSQVVIATGYATRYFRPLAGRFRDASHLRARDQPDRMAARAGGSASAR